MAGNTIFGASDDLFLCDPILRFEPNKFGAPTFVALCVQRELERQDACPIFKISKLQVCFNRQKPIFLAEILGLIDTAIE